MHHVTIKEYLNELEPREPGELQSNLVYRMIRRKSFNHAKTLGRWLILVDGTKLDEGVTKKMRIIWNVPITVEQTGRLPGITEVYWKQNLFLK